MILQSVIVVFDKNGNYFQTWWGTDAIQHGIEISKRIKGSYVIIGGT